MSYTHAVASIVNLTEAYDELDPSLQDKFVTRLTKDFTAMLGSRQVLVGPNFFAHSYKQKMERGPKGKKEVYYLDKHYSTLVAKTTTY